MAILAEHPQSATHGQLFNHLEIMSVEKSPEKGQTGPVGSTDGSAISGFEVEFEAYPLRNQRGEIYYTIPAEMCRIGIVSRRRRGRGPDGKDVELTPETEAAFIRGNGSWLPPLFRETNYPKPHSPH